MDLSGSRADPEHNARVLKLQCFSSVGTTDRSELPTKPKKMGRSPIDVGSMQAVAAHLVLQRSNTDAERFGGILAMKIAGFQCQLDRCLFALIHRFG